MLSRMPYKVQQKIILLLFVTVPLMLLMVFVYYPAVELVRLSFSSWNGYSATKPWVGWDNYVQVFKNPEIFGVFKNNFSYFVVGILQNIVALYFAVILSSKIRGRNFFRLFLFSPYVLNGVAVAFMFGYVYNTYDGSLNHFLALIGLNGLSETSWLGNLTIVNYTLASVGAWKYMGFNMVVYLAALQSIPKDIYEAAEIDGASGTKTFFYITLPNIFKIIELNLFLTVTGALEVFDIPFVMTGGGPAGATETYVLRTVQTAFEYSNFGLASAMSVVLLIFVIIVVSIQRLLLSVWEGK